MAGHLDVYQRTAPWVIPRNDRTYSPPRARRPAPGVASLITRRARVRAIVAVLALGLPAVADAAQSGPQPDAVGVALGLVVPASAGSRVGDGPGRSSSGSNTSSTLGELRHRSVVRLWPTPASPSAHTLVSHCDAIADHVGDRRRTSDRQANRDRARDEIDDWCTTADQPDDSTDRQLLGVATSAGMGFTVALFITGFGVHESTYNGRTQHWGS